MKLGSKSDSVLDNDDAIRLLGQSTKLKGLHVTGQMIASTNSKFNQLITAVPTTLELLFLGDLGYDSEQYFDPTHDAAPAAVGPPQPLIPFLPRLSILGLLDIAVDDATWPLIFKNCPGLKTLCLSWTNGLEAAEALSTAARQYCPALNQLRLFLMTAGVSPASFDAIWAMFLSSSTCGWEALEIHATSSVVSVGSLSMTALLPRLSHSHPLHVATLKTLELGEGAEISSRYVRQLYEAAPDLTIIVNYETLPRPTVLGK
ncbi:hypothetical protein BG015_001454 [Linnemannia schmuckeri]|uniref:Uncharacterized protein n=1 Tax=Linnemannia schmuckeri TaxID=64567 RepID=A0A9P5RPS6_9FUNG|nr:hypothetical protein BG015_001454 [Linnemannia schmuckeri]